MRHYEITFIIDPVLSSSEIDDTASTYEKHLVKEGCTIVHNNNMGLRQLAYPIKKRTSGMYRCIEVETDSSDFINKLELALRRDERIMRFLTVKLDKYGVKYNQDKRDGLIGKVKKKEEKEADEKARLEATRAAHALTMDSAPTTPESQIEASTDSEEE